MILNHADSMARVDSLASAALSPTEKDALWHPVVDQLKAFGGNNDIADHSILYIFFMGFIGGLLALVMPCIWPVSIRLMEKRMSIRS